MPESQSPELFTHRNFKLIKGVHLPHDVDQIRDLEINDSDVFVVTYPKSGTIWCQQILLLLKSKGSPDSIYTKDTFSNSDLMPWIEINGQVQKFITEESPRYRVTHLPYHLMPKDICQGKGKVIYVSRNPKDVLVSFYHFHNMTLLLETPKSFEEFFEKFMEGDVIAGRWFDHIKSWFPHKDDPNMLFISYEKMIQDLESVIRSIIDFLGVDLTQDQLNDVVKHSTFKNMKQIPQASYEQVPGNVFDTRKGHFMRKGTIGDWKNHFTVAQNELFDEVFEKEMMDFPMSFIWDIKELS